MQFSNITARKATSNDFDAIWEIFHSVIKTGDTYSYAPNTTREEAFTLWMNPQKTTYIATMDGSIVGTYFITPNQPGLGSHVANGAYMVHPATQGKGVGTFMVNHSVEEAKKLGYLAMQFNLVFSSNEHAVRLYQKLGFNIIGTTPKGVNHTVKGLIDTYIMHRYL